MDEVLQQNGDSVRSARQNVGKRVSMPEGRLAGEENSLRISGGQNEEKSKKRFGLLAILTTKGPFLVKTRRNPKNVLAKSPS
ncbi:MAG: hypothetical protein QM270_05780 [Bacillota bacterium]|nr:hypothetical protein [Bacillota bacterium]